MVFGIEQGLEADPCSFGFFQPDWQVLRQEPLQNVVRSAARLLPDGVVLITKQQSLLAIGLVPQIKAVMPVPKVYLVMPATQQLVKTAVAAGADGCFTAEQTAMADGLLLDGACRQALAAALKAQVNPLNAAISLTLTEQQVLQHLAAGRDNAAIAQGMFLSVGTVRNYISALQHKTGSKNRVQLLLWAQRHGIGSDEPLQ